MNEQVCRKQLRDTLQHQSNIHCNYPHISAERNLKWFDNGMFKSEMFPEQQISILEWFLKDHVTLKTGVMMLKTLIWTQDYIIFEPILPLKTVTLNCNNISLFVLPFLSNKSSLGEQKKQKQIIIIIYYYFNLLLHKKQFLLWIYSKMYCSVKSMNIVAVLINLLIYDESFCFECLEFIMCVIYLCETLVRPSWPGLPGRRDFF